MHPFAVIERLEVIKDVCPCLGLHAVARAMHALILQAVEEAFRAIVILAVPLATHRALHAVHVQLPQ